MINDDDNDEDDDDGELIGYTHNFRTISDRSVDRKAASAASSDTTVSPLFYNAPINTQTYMLSVNRCMVTRHAVAESTTK